MCFTFDPENVQPLSEVDGETLSLPAPNRPSQRDGLFGENWVSHEEAERNGAHFIQEARAIRHEAEQLIVWVRYGEGSNSPIWGASQQAYAADLRATLRKRAADLKARIDSKCENPTKVLDSVFNGRLRTDYTEEIIKAARMELGL
jgi:hypothetical protein